MRRIRKYNKKLLPHPKYKKIADCGNLKRFFLCRLSTKKKWHITKRDRFLDFIEERELGRGMSMVLLSKFEHKDAQIRPTGKVGDSHFEEWTPLDGNVPPPSVRIHKNANFIGITIGDILHIDKIQIELEFKNGTKRKDFVFLKVIHKPTKCNFWHFEIMVTAIDNDGYEYKIQDYDQLSIKARGRFIKQASAALKTLLNGHLKHSSECKCFYLEKSYYQS